MRKKITTKKRKQQKTSTKFTKVRQQTFLQLLKETGNISAAARGVGMSRHGVTNYHNPGHTSYDPEFAQAWDDALEEATDDLEQEARRRAVNGIIRNIYYKGDVVGEEIIYSDNLMGILLKANRPEKFRERHTVDGNLMSPLADLLSSALDKD